MNTQNGNVFATPKVNVVDDTAGGNHHMVLTTAARYQLSRTRPWVIFFSILGFIATVSMAVFTFGVLFSALNLPKDIDLGLFRLASVVTAVIYLIVNIACLIASIHLFKYAAAIKRFVQSGKPADFEQALSSQAKFWKITGLVVLLILLFLLVKDLFQLYF